MPCIMGIDSGLTVTKAVIFDADGTALAIARRRVPQLIPAPQHVERDMDGLWAATADAIREAVAACGRPASDIVAIAATAHGDGIYLLDEDKNPLGPAIVSLDTRADAIAEAWSAGEVGQQSLELTGQKPHASAPSAILRWVREHQPERYARIAHFIAAKDWLRFRLCGTIGTDRTEASTSFTDVRTQDYAEDAFRLFGLDRLAGRQPPMAASTEIVGGVTAGTARLTGLVAGTPVMAGLHDVTASALASIVPDPKAFRSGRHFAAWLGLVPRQNSSGGKSRLGRISKQGNRYIRQLLILGATSVLRYVRRDGDGGSSWVGGLLRRRPPKVVAVALANKMARIAWSIMRRGGEYEEINELRAVQHTSS